jgi:hypothetical protein
VGIDPNDPLRRFLLQPKRGPAASIDVVVESTPYFALAGAPRSAHQLVIDGHLDQVRPRAALDIAAPGVRSLAGPP